MALTDKVAFCHLHDLKADLGITGHTLDTALERRILAASALVERYCNRAFRRTVGKVEKLAGFGTTRLLPSLTPIEAIASITFDGAIVDPLSYEVETDSGGLGWAIYAESGWLWTAPGVQTISEMPVPLPGAERKVYAVTYTGGFTLPNDTLPNVPPTLPFEIQEATTLLAAHLYAQRGRDGNVVGESVGDASVTLGFIGGPDAAPRESFGIPASIAAMLDGWKRAT
jgi:hypothetical protein